MSRPKKYEDMNIEELKKEMGRVNKLVGFKPKRRETGKDGAILLDPNDPNDVEWYEDDEAYGYK